MSNVSLVSAAFARVRRKGLYLHDQEEAGRNKNLVLGPRGNTIIVMCQISLRHEVYSGLHGNIFPNGFPLFTIILYTGKFSYCKLPHGI